jgi:phosphoribosylanthranilate isomerase
VTEIKICGITNREDAACAAACGADAVGFIFHPQSLRYVTPEIAQKIIKDLPESIAKVGVCVNLDQEEINQIVAFCGLDMVQLHGAESPAFCRQFPRSRVIKAFALRGEDDLKGLRAYPVAAILVDAYDPARYGGIGERADWDLAAKVKDTHPLILAGGLSRANIREAIELVSPDAVDINSGVERAPGQKDHTKVKAIIELVHSLRVHKTTIFNRGYAPVSSRGDEESPGLSH